VKTFEESGSKRKGKVKAVDGVSFHVERGTMFTLLGPSGCGKTTTLRCIAGLETPDAGRIVVNGRIFNSRTDGVNLPVNQRELGMVYQSYAIWPHMDVYQNVAFPLTAAPRRRRLPKAKVRDRVERVLEVVQLDDLGDRPATDLSGGQQQRLALARALVMEPQLLLLDEPLSNLDANLREEMRFELKRLQRDLGITTVYVTHDQVEALSMSKYIGVMKSGKLEQIGRPREIYDKPASKFVARFIGVSNLFAGVVSDTSPDGLRLITTAFGTLRVRSTGEFPRGTQVQVAVRPEHIELGSLSDAKSNWIGTVRARAFVGDAVEHVVRMGNGTDVRVKSGPNVSVPPGSTVQLRITEDYSTVLADD